MGEWSKWRSKCSQWVNRQSGGVQCPAMSLTAMSLTGISLVAGLISQWFSCPMVMVSTFIRVALLVWRCLSNVASFVLCAVYSVKDHHTLPSYLSLLKRTCFRQVVLDKWFPLIYALRFWSPWIVFVCNPAAPSTLDTNMDMNIPLRRFIARIWTSLLLKMSSAIPRVLPNVPPPDSKRHPGKAAELRYSYPRQRPTKLCELHSAIIRDTGVCEKNTTPGKRTLGEIRLNKKTNQGLESGFCCWVAWPRLVQKECVFHRHRYQLA